MSVIQKSLRILEQFNTYLAPKKEYILFLKEGKDKMTFIMEELGYQRQLPETANSATIFKNC